jgi:ubiquinol-cytochrome c reductase cytochrome c1 subunit
MTRFLVALLCLVVAGSALAAGVGPKLESAQTNLGDRASLQRGARLFLNHCASCHSAGYVRYSRMAKDLGLLDAGLSEAEIQQSLNFTGAKFGEPITVAMESVDATEWFGAAAPDLSLTARAKHGGVDWIYTYLKSFYFDEQRPLGWNNTVLPGASMPHVLWELQGVQRLVTEAKQVGADGQPEPCHTVEIDGMCFVRFELSQAGRSSAQEYEHTIRDIANFMDYMAEPAGIVREQYGVWVLLFLSFFTLIAYFLYQEYWRDVH